MAQILTQQELIDLSVACERATLRTMAEKIDAFVERLSSWDALPDKFDISSERWVEAEVEIDRAAQSGDLQRTCELCDEYAERVDKYLAQWETLMSKKARAA